MSNVIGGITYDSFVTFVDDYKKLLGDIVIESTWPDMWQHHFVLGRADIALITAIQIMDLYWNDMHDHREMSIVKLPDGNYSWIIWVNDNPR